jgi:murein DD-endopeptidase MepM/ murein hydrolase activator NlpD
MKLVRRSCVPGALLALGIAIVLIFGYHARGDAAALEAAPSEMGNQAAAAAGEAECATTEPPPPLPPWEEAAVRDAVQETLDAYNSRQAGSMPLEILSIWGQDSWAVVECVRDLSGQPASGTESTPVLARQFAGQWTAALPGDSVYASWLDQVPDRFMAPATKDEVRQLNMVDSAQICPSLGIYRLPYADGATVWITQDSVQHGGPIDMDSHTSSAVAAAMSGWVVGFHDEHSECCCDSSCSNCTNWIKLSHPSGEFTRYLHIAQNSVTVTVGQWVEAGTVIATQSDVGNSCGNDRPETGCGNPPGTTKCGIHVHFEVRSSTGAYLKPRICDGQGGWFYPEHGNSHVATGCQVDGCFSSLKIACGSSQPSWGFSATGAAVQSTCTGRRGADHLDQAGAPQPQAVSEGEAGEVSAPAAIASNHEPVELQHTFAMTGTYRIVKSVFGAGGGEKSSTSLIMNGTQGQSTDLSRRESSSYVLVPGYWARWYRVAKLKVYLPVVVRKY